MQNCNTFELFKQEPIDFVQRRHQLSKKNGPQTIVRMGYMGSWVQMGCISFNIMFKLKKLGVLGKHIIEGIVIKVENNLKFTTTNQENV